MTGVLTNRKDLETDAYTGRTPGEDEDRAE